MFEATRLESRYSAHHGTRLDLVTVISCLAPRLRMSGDVRTYARVERIVRARIDKLRRGARACISHILQYARRGYMARCL